MPKIELGREYQTRDGRRFELWKIEGGYAYGRVEDSKSPGGWLADSWNAETGSYFARVESPSPCDLIPVTRKIKVDEWITVTSDGQVGFRYETESKAKNAAKAYGHIAIKHLEFEVTEGEGL